jgi:hypothetical protein
MQGCRRGGSVIWRLSRRLSLEVRSKLAGGGSRFRMVKKAQKAPSKV